MTQLIDGACSMQASITWQDFLRAYKELAAVRNAAASSGSAASSLTWVQTKIPRGELLPTLARLSLRQQYRYGQQVAGGAQVSGRRRRNQR